MRPGDTPDTPVLATRYTLRSLARRYHQLEAEAADLKTQMARFVDNVAPTLAAELGGERGQDSPVLGEGAMSADDESVVGWDRDGVGAVVGCGGRVGAGGRLGGPAVWRGAQQRNAVQLESGADVIDEAVQWPVAVQKHAGEVAERNGLGRGACRLGGSTGGDVDQQADDRTDRHEDHQGEDNAAVGDHPGAEGLGEEVVGDGDGRQCGRQPGGEPSNRGGYDGCATWPPAR